MSSIQFNSCSEYNKTLIEILYNYFFIILARTPEIGQGLGRFLSCGARKQEQT